MLFGLGNTEACTIVRTHIKTVTHDKKICCNVLGGSFYRFPESEEMPVVAPMLAPVVAPLVAPILALFLTIALFVARVPGRLS
jgi:hypothetical protein